jgi:hypothetical protein
MSHERELPSMLVREEKVSITWLEAWLDGPDLQCQDGDELPSHMLNGRTWGNSQP